MKDKALNKIGFAVMQLAFGNYKSAILCLESAIKAIKKIK